MLFKKSPLKFYAGGDNLIHCVGRFDRTEPTAPKVWAPGAYIEFKFKGNFCEIELEDELRFLMHHNFIEVVIDGGYDKHPTLHQHELMVKELHTFLKGLKLS